MTNLSEDIGYTGGKVKPIKHISPEAIPVPILIERDGTVLL